MRMNLRSVLMVAVALCMVVGIASAVPFDPVFRLLQVNGDVSVKAPDQGRFRDAEEGKAYPYGTALRTGKRASVIVVLAENNTCQVGALAGMVISEGTVDAAKKTIMLEGGKIEVTLEDGNSLAVATPCSAAETTGGTFTVELKAEAELKITIYTCAAGQLAIMSEMFQVPVLDADDFLSVCAQDQSFVRLKNIKGEFEVSFTDDTGTPRNVALQQNGVVKIWRSKAETSDAIVVTILLVAPDGSMTEAINYTLEPEALEAVTTGDDDDDDDDTDAPTEYDPPPGGDDDDDDDDDDDIDPRAIPTFTPVGDR